MLNWLLQNIWAPIAFGVVSTVLAGVVVRLARRSGEIRPRRSLLNFWKGEPVLFVFPGRDSSSPTLLPRVAFEDMLAVNYVERLLTLSKWRDDKIQMRQHDGFIALDAHDPAKNLVLICSPRSNHVTNEYLNKLNSDGVLSWRFEKSESGDMTIRADSTRAESATFSQERMIRSRGDVPAESTLDDLAVLIKAPNPYNPKAKVLIVAGIRSIGTWGAAKFLRQNDKEIYKKTKGRDFAWLLKVRYRHWRIESVEDTGTFLFI